MATIERRIDALGGAPNSSSDYDMAYHDGHSEALRQAIEIGAEADDTINELIERVEDILDGNFSDIVKWAESARRTINLMKSARSR